MPIFPGTAMAHAAPTPPRTGDDVIEWAIRDILGSHSHISPPEGRITSATVVLRAYVKKTAAEVRDVVAALPAADPRRVAAERSAAEGLHRALTLGPGNGLRSAFDYARGLAQVAQELRDHRAELRTAPEEDLSC
ncbi:DUF6415 family natural product biosynthesis protein [Streptomyces sp. UNOC14_S4]|uniref:DUF6415 family natural product biosynthesis protein n=1 Tax=Streptomyces sp. UNOC14_S4 TaxID=2872340 RepID=UPI001E53CFC6|nr:DUF6415 family natural product biosynthesis protein [Streptomyces sp. UNOC14_S4]MCC3771199.1 hypothetical protein [Streptomyces sp. UNOC14_S4]